MVLLEGFRLLFRRVSDVEEVQATSELLDLIGLFAVDKLESHHELLDLEFVLSSLLFCDLVTGMFWSGPLFSFAFAPPLTTLETLCCLLLCRRLQGKHDEL